MGDDVGKKVGKTVCDNIRLVADEPPGDAVGLVLGLTAGNTVVMMLDLLNRPLADALGLVLVLTVSDTVGMILNLLGGPLGDALGLVTGLIIHTTGGKEHRRR